MPHLVILYTPQPRRARPTCRRCAARWPTRCSRVRDEAGAQVFPTGGTRVLAYPAAHYASRRCADGRGGDGDYGFVYLNLRMGRGRSAAVHQGVGEALSAVAQAHFAPLLAARPLGLTLQIDEGAEVFDAKLSNLHPLFATRQPDTMLPTRHHRRSSPASSTTRARARTPVRHFSKRHPGHDASTTATRSSAPGSRSSWPTAARSRAARSA